MGACNVAISSLPSKIVRIVAIFGLPHDRDTGFELLAECTEGGKKGRGGGVCRDTVFDCVRAQ
jgi:hypothetical protein